MACRRGYVALGLYEFGAAVVYSVEFDATVWNETVVERFMLS
jgi:hypothetical protein